MKAKTAFNTYDVVKFDLQASIVAENNHAKDYRGIVKEASDMNSYVEWYDCRSKDTTREVNHLTGWIQNSDIVLVGSLWHLISNKFQVANMVVKVTNATPEKSAETVEAPRAKRKCTRKPGAAKPGPKPKKDKLVRALDPVKQEIVLTDTKPVEDTSNKTVIVPVPMGKFKTPMNREWYLGQLAAHRRNDVIATGKFKHFPTRPIIESSITDSGCHLTHKIDWCLDFAIVGEKPGPSKIDKFKRLGTPMITEEQWLAMIGTPGFEFEK